MSFDKYSYFCFVYCSERNNDESKRKNFIAKTLRIIVIYETYI